MRWTAVQDAYLADEASRGLAAPTLDGRRRWLSIFQGFCAENQVVALAAVTPALLVQYEAFLRAPWPRLGTPLQASTRNDAVATVRAFLRWAVAHHRLLLDPTAALVTPKPPPPVLEVLTVAEVEMLLAAPDDGSLLGLRDRALLELFYGVGVRRLECFFLDLDDVALSRAALLVRRGKGGHERLLPLGDHLCHVLSAYLCQSRPRLARNPGETALFLAMDGQRLTWSQMGRQVNVWARRSLGRSVWPHALRHALATHLLQAGADLESIRRLLGHRHLESTQRYLHVQTADVHNTWHQAHPRARWRPPKV